MSKYNKNMNLVSKTSKLKKLKFNTKQELRQAIEKYLASHNKKDEMMIYAHQINDYRSEVGASDPILKLNSVLENGLAASRYSTIDGTVTCMGSNKDKDIVDNILNYDYHMFGENRRDDYPIVVLAFPRYINVDGKDVEYSTSQYAKEKPDSQKKLTALLDGKISKYQVPDPQYTPKRWIDVVKGFDNFTPNDTLFAFYKDNEGYYLCLPSTHWLEQDEKKYNQHKQNLAEHIKKYDSNLEKAIIAECQKYQQVIEDYLNDID